MAVNVDVTLGVILEQKQLFFDLLDHAESIDGPGADEFSITQYLRELDYTIGKAPADARRRMAEALDLKNLDRCGLLNYCEERDDRLLFKPFVLDMIRHLDKSRLKELSDADLNSLRQQLSHARETLNDGAFTWDPSSLEYRDVFNVVLASVQNAASHIRQNIEALHGQSLQLAKLVDEAHESGIPRSAQVEVALTKIFEITERHIKPTLIFLDPRADWKGRGIDAPMKIIGTMMDEFSRRNRHRDFASLNRSYLAMLSSSGRITEILRSLDSYLKMHDQQRRLYEGIERRYDDLLTRVLSLHDGKRGYKLKPSDPHFTTVTALYGLKDRKKEFSSRMNWPRDTGTGLMDEYMRVRLAAYTYKAEKPRRAVVADLEADERERTRRERMPEIMRVASDISLVAGEDIYSQIHSQLETKLPDYEISELLDALYFTPGSSHHVIFNRRRTLSGQGRTLQYFERHLLEPEQ